MNSAPRLSRRLAPCSVMHSLTPMCGDVRYRGRLKLAHTQGTSGRPCANDMLWDLCILKAALIDREALPAAGLDRILLQDSHQSINNQSWLNAILYGSCLWWLSACPWWSLHASYRQAEFPDCTLWHHNAKCNRYAVRQAGKLPVRRLGAHNMSLLHVNWRLPPLLPLQSPPAAVLLPAAAALRKCRCHCQGRSM